jgi:hypothetical protein
MGVTGLDFAVLTLEDILPLERVHMNIGTSSAIVASIATSVPPAT